MPDAVITQSDVPCAGAARPRSRGPLRARIGALAGAVLVAGAVVLVWWLLTLTPRRFGTVEAGHLYRSGQISTSQLDYVKRNYGIERVLCLLNPDDPRTQAERRAAESLGMEWVNVPLPGNGASEPADRDRIRAFVLSTAQGPAALVHCAAGVNRTGLAVGMYRIHRDRWSVAQVLDELRSYGFDDEPQHQNLRDALQAEAELAARPGG